MDNPKITVIALGGSLMVPHLSEKNAIDVSFLRSFRNLVLREMKKERRFVIVAGGGKICRLYQKAAVQIARIPPDDLDWIGIQATRLNAHLLRTLFAKEAQEKIVDHNPSFQEVLKMVDTKKKLFVASGWRPGNSTDYVAVMLAEKFGAKEFIDAGDIDFVYDKDPKAFPEAKPIPRLSWREYRNLIPPRWTPGMASPIDPIAAKLAEKEKITAKILKGTDLQNLQKAIEGKPFIGTVLY